TMLVPVQYQRIMARPDFDKYDLSSFQMKFSTSAPFHGELKADVLARWPGGLVEFYGMTEGGGSCMLVAHQHPDKLHTVGQPLDGHDMRVIDEDGFLTLMDRRKDMIISGGFNIYPSDLEAVLRQHPDLLEVTVIGVQSTSWGETPVGYVVAKPGTSISA